MNFERFFYEVLANVLRYIEARPLHLGGSSGSQGGRPGGYVGYLPQTRVSYDITEAAINQPAQEPSLLDNLNRIRYRINNLETSIAVSGLTLEKENVPIASNIRTIDFRGGVVIEPVEPNEAIVFITISGFGDSVLIPSGVYNVNLTNQINGSTNTFTISDTIIPTSLQVYVNGLAQNPTSVFSNGTFSIDFVPQVGDTLFVNYDKLVGIPASVSLNHSWLSNLTSDDHPQYLTLGRATNHFYTEEEVNALISPLIAFSGLLPANRGDLIVGNGTSFSKLPIIESGNLFLVTDLVEPLRVKWASLDVLNQIKKSFRQQIIFTVASTNLFSVGVKPIRYYVHQVGDNPQIEEILCYLGTSPSQNNLRIKILRNGTNILTTPNYIEIPVGQNLKLINTGFDPSINYNDYFQLEISQGDLYAADLTVHLRFVSEV